MSKPRLTLVLPDYALLFASDINRGLIPTELQGLLKRAKFEANDAGYYQQLINLFAEHTAAPNALPIAMLRGGSRNSLCADPCYLHPDRDKLRLFYRDLELSMEEAEALCRCIQGLFEEFGASISVQTADHWLIELQQPVDTKFSALEGLDGQTVTGFLPTGADAQRWIRLWNEVQMVLFDCPENQAREAAGKLPINSLWFWGQGTLPSLQAWEHVSGGDNMVVRLSEASRSCYQAGVTAYKQIDADMSLHVMAFDKGQDWSSQLDALTQHWLLPAFQALQHWQLNELEVIVPEWGSYRLTPLRSWKIWL